MSEPLDNSKDSINELENTIGSEIDLNVANVTDNFHQDAALHAKLYKLLRQVVSKSVAELKELSLENKSRLSNEIVEAVPISFKVPENCDNVNTMRLDTIISEAQRNTKQRSRTSLVAEISVTFQVPQDFLKNAMDMGKFSIFRAGDNIGQNNNNNNNNGSQFSFTERLEGWKIERRQRINGRFDLYYRHERSKAMFRSTIEVVNFLLYEAYPDKLKPGQDEKSEEEQYPVVEKPYNTRKRSKKRPNSLILNPNSPYKTETKTKQRKTFSTDHHDACKEHKVENEEKFDQGEEERVETVEELLDRANKNFLNSTPTSTAYSSSFVYESDTDEEFEEFHAAFAYEQPTDEDDEINHQTVEEFLESAYNNLLNYFNDNHGVHKPKVSSKHKRKRSVEKPKRQRKRSVASPRKPIPRADNLMEEKDIIPKMVEAINPKEVDEASTGNSAEANASKVETDPVKIKGNNNIPSTNLETSPHTKVEAVDNVVKVEATTTPDHEVEASLSEANSTKADANLSNLDTSSTKVGKVKPTEAVAINPIEAVANPEATEGGAPAAVGASTVKDEANSEAGVGCSPPGVRTNPNIAVTSPAILEANPDHAAEGCLGGVRADATDAAANYVLIGANNRNVAAATSPAKVNSIEVEANPKAAEGNLAGVRATTPVVEDNTVEVGTNTANVAAIVEANPVEVEVNHETAEGKLVGVGANINTTDVVASPVIIGTNVHEVVATTPAIAEANPQAGRGDGDGRNLAKVVDNAMDVARDVANVATANASIEVEKEVKANSDSVEMEAAGKEGSLVVLSSYSDQCDLINYIPLADNMFDIGIPLVNRRNGEK